VQAKRQTKVERFEPMLVFSHLKSGFVEVRKSSKLFWLTFFNAIILGTMWGSGEFHQILLEDVGLAVGLFGLVYALKRMVGVIIPPFVHHMSKKVSIPMYCITSGIIMALILILTLLANAPGTMAILLGLSAAPGIALTVAGNDFKNKLINGSSRATVLSMSNLIQQIVTLVFVGVTGVIVAHASLPVIYLAWGIGLLILIAVMTPAFGRAYHRG